MQGKKSGNNILWLALAVILIGATAAVGYALTLKTSVTVPLSANPPAAAPTQAPAFRPVPAGGLKINSVFGAIASINDGISITIKNAQVSANPDDPQGPTERTILFTDKTAIIAQVPLTAKEMAAATKEYQAAVKAGKSAQPPEPYKEEHLAPGDLRLTMNITVTSDDDIRNAETVTASKITFLAPPSSLTIAE